MKVLVVSYKVCWREPAVASGYVSYAGFPFQMEALAALFAETRLMLLERRPPPPEGAVPLRGRGLVVDPLPEPEGHDFRRKLNLLAWLPRCLPALWRAVGRADAVHALVPGDLGTLGLLVALLRRKPLLVRHCGTWGDRSTLANRFLAWLLPRIAGGRRVVLATGGGKAPPGGCPEAHWIFSTTLSQDELEAMPAAEPWRPGETLRLVTVGRLSRGKNARAVVEALGLLRRQGFSAHLSVVGDGPEEEFLQDLAVRLDAEVTFHGNVDHDRVLEILGESHLFVFPTRVAEGFPKAVIEAMGCGLPVLVAPVSVLPLLVEEGGGRLLADTTGEAVAEGILALINDPESLAAMGRAARATAEGYTLERWRREIASALEKAWGRRFPAREEAA